MAVPFPVTVVMALIPLSPWGVTKMAPKWGELPKRLWRYLHDMDLCFMLVHSVVLRRFT